ncbi:CMD domain protein [Rhizobiaceae bacterium BDR2-2]|uniref:CMD domain protein n=1 Tax=Ectorhizobium quercum TaxID=2965071 RepID=A0AAE3SVN1_9HYPH|nr:CMD domain protein [Ectorhizobium quercum]MCX8998302.1 CMD domain protein [Ectorhizobium quercum]
MTAHSDTDVIDTVLHLDTFPDIRKLREQRARLKHLTQTSYEAALRPREPRNFSYAMRAALAARMAGLWKAVELVAHYRDLLAREEATPDLAAIADPAFRPDESGDTRLATILAHVDLVTLTPREATRAHIEKLYAAGLDDRDIVTLAGLIAFVNYQVLVVAGLKMLRDN